MTKKIIFLALGSLLLAPCSAAEAQRPTKVPRIGVLTGSSLSTTSARIEAFREGLRDLGYVEGKSIVIDWRFWEGKQRSPARICRRASAAQGRRHRRSWRRRYTRSQGGHRDNSRCDDFGWRCCRKRFGCEPGAAGWKRYRIGNLRPELSGKRLELLKEVLPGLSRVAVFASSGRGDYVQILKEIDLAAGALGVKLHSLDIRSPKDFETAFRDAAKGRAEAVLVQVPGPILSSSKSCRRTRNEEPAPGNIRKWR